MKIMMTMFGWDDSGGGTIFPRQVALELQRRGHEVLVFYSAVSQMPEQPAYALSQMEEAGVQLIGVHNRPAVFLDASHPEREISDQAIVSLFTHFLDSFKPDIVHYHNFLGLSLGVTHPVAERGLPNFYTPYNFWLICPTLYLTMPDMSNCHGVNATGSNCLHCTRSPIAGERYVQRRNRLQTDYHQNVGRCLATSLCVKELLIENGYYPDQIDILRLGNKRSETIWKAVGETRQPQTPTQVHFGFMGSIITIKGLHILVQAVQYLTGDFKVTLYGDGPTSYIDKLKELDEKQRIVFAGRFADELQFEILSHLDVGIVPSVCFDHSPLVIGEFLAARVPVIGAAIGGIPDYIQPGTGTTFTAADPVALAQQMQAVIDHPEQIQSWQENILPPIPFQAYVDTLEEHYHQGLHHNLAETQERRIQFFIRNRDHTIFGKCYALSGLPAHLLTPIPDPLSDPPIDYVVDISPTLTPQRFELQSPLEKAGQIWVPSAISRSLLLQQSPHLQNKLHVVPPFIPEPLSSVSPLDLPTEKSIRLLSIIGKSSDWKPLLTCFTQLYTSADDISLILLPWAQSAEEFYSDLEAWLEQAVSDQALVPDLVLLDPEDIQEDWDTLLRAVHGVLTISPLSLTDTFLNKALGHGLPLWFHEAESTQEFNPLLELWVPSLPLLERLAQRSPWYKASASHIQAHNQQLVSQIRELVNNAGEKDAYS